MNLYITFADKSKIKKSFLNLRKYLIIYTPDIVQAAGFSGKELDECSLFLINEEIKRQIQRGSVRRKLLSMIYSNPEMNDETVREVIHYSTGLSTLNKVIFLTDEYENEEYYELFDEVSFFPSIKKVHILQCATHFVTKGGLLDELNGDTFFN